MKRGFTLVETAVVIAAISVLVALALQVGGAVRDAGRRVQSHSNLRQMTFAAQQYALDHHHFPAAIRYENRDGTFVRVAWDWETTFSGTLLGPGPLWTYTDHPERVMQCPAYDGPANFDGDPVTGYNYNTSFLGGEAMSVVAGWEVVRQGLTWAECDRPSTAAIFGVGGASFGANKFMRSPGNREGHPWSVIYAGGQAFRYRGATLVAYLDGHTATIEERHRGPHADSSLVQDILGHPANGFLSADDAAYDPG